jgi:putative ABC transport system permease protein
MPPRRRGGIPLGSVARQARADAWPLSVGVVVVALVAFVTAVVPRLANQVSADEIHAAFADAGPRADVVVSIPLSESLDEPRPLWADTAGSATFDAGKLAAGLPDVFAAPVTSIISSELKAGVVDGRPGRLRFAFVNQEGASGVVWLSGRAPQATATMEDVASSYGKAFPVEVALSAAVAAALEVTDGQILHLTDSDGAPLDVPVTGIFAPVDLGNAAWGVVPTLVTPKVVKGAEGRVELSAMVTAGSLPFARLALTPGAFSCQDTFRVRPDKLDASNAASVATAVRGRVAGPDGFGITGATLSVYTRLDVVLDSALARIRSASAQASLILAGVLASAASVLLLSAGLVVQRRSAVLANQRARGASLPAIGRGLAWESIALAAFGEGGGLAVAGLVVPGAMSWGWIAPSLVLAAVAGPALGVRSAARTSAPPPALRLDPRSRAKAAAARRVAFEAAVVLLTVGAFAALRARGVTASGSTLGADVVVLAAPALAAGTVALVSLRLLPPLRRWARRAATRTRGAATVLAAARIANPGLPLIALVLSTSLFTASLAIEATVRSGQLDGSWQTVGADVVVSTNSPSGLPPEVASLPAMAGVEAAAGARVAPGLQLLGDGVDLVVRVVAVDSAQYEALLAASPLADAPQLALLGASSAGAGTNSVLALTSGVPVTATALSLRWEGKAVAITAVGAAPAMPGDEPYAGPTVVVDRASLARVTGTPIAPDVLWVDGEGAEPAVRTVLGPGDATIATREGWLAARKAAPVTAAFETLLAGAAVVLMALAGLAVFLVAAAGSRGRATALAGYRVLGLPRAQGGRVALGELLVPVLVGSVVGTATGAAVASLLVGPLDLAVLTGQAGAPTLVLPWWCWMSVPALVIAVLVAVSVELAGHRRDQLGQVMRAG